MYLVYNLGVSPLIKTFSNTKCMILLSSSTWKLEMNNTITLYWQILNLDLLLHDFNKK